HAAQRHEGVPDQHQRLGLQLAGAVPLRAVDRAAGRDEARRGGVLRQLVGQPPQPERPAQGGVVGRADDGRDVHRFPRRDARFGESDPRQDRGHELDSGGAVGVAGYNPSIPMRPLSADSARESLLRFDLNIQRRHLLVYVAALVTAAIGAFIGVFPMNAAIAVTLCAGAAAGSGVFYWLYSRGVDRRVLNPLWMTVDIFAV